MGEFVYYSYSENIFNFCNSIFFSDTDGTSTTPAEVQQPHSM